MKNRTIIINETETAYLEMLLNSDFKMRLDASLHAVSHGSDYDDPTIDTVSNIIIKIKNAPPASS